MRTSVSLTPTAPLGGRVGMGGILDARAPYVCWVSESHPLRGLGGAPVLGVRGPVLRLTAASNPGDFFRPLGLHCDRSFRRWSGTVAVPPEGPIRSPGGTASFLDISALFLALLISAPLGAGGGVGAVLLDVVEAGSTAPGEATLPAFVGLFLVAVSPAAVRTVDEGRRVPVPADHGACSSHHRSSSRSPRSSRSFWTRQP